MLISACVEVGDDDDEDQKFEADGSCYLHGATGRGAQPQPPVGEGGKNLVLLTYSNHVTENINPNCKLERRDGMGKQWSSTVEYY